ncbi:hypothetical protein B0H11DRAFT_2234380 [Mycena galericulata]|nr:hypothetical protein B0H11DRAFT_2234380 [Mycena galericulata]
MPRARVHDSLPPSTLLRTCPVPASSLYTARRRLAFSPSSPPCPRPSVLPLPLPLTSFIGTPSGPSFTPPSPRYLSLFLLPSVPSISFLFARLAVTRRHRTSSAPPHSSPSPHPPPRRHPPPSSPPKSHPTATPPNSDPGGHFDAHWHAAHAETPATPQPVSFSEGIFHSCFSVLFY